MRKPAVGTRTLVLGAIAAVLVVTCIVVAAVPATRGAVRQAWCDLSGTWCGPGLPPPGDGPDEDGRLVELSPVEAATWGNYYALGDSYSSGDGAEDYAPDTAVADGCWRSANAYPETVARSYDFAGELTFLACSGQRGNVMLESLDSEDSQIASLTPHTSLVTIGIGGNDLGFTSVLKTCMLRVPLLESSACQAQEDDVDKRMRTFEATFADVLAEVRERVPDSRVIVLGYPRLFVEEPSGLYYTLTSGDQIWLNDTIQRFNEQLEEAVAEVDAGIADWGEVGSVEFVDVYDALDGHEVGTEEPWVNGVLLRSLTDGITIDRSTFHPTSEGQNAVSARVRAQVEEGPGRPIYATRSTVDNASPEVLAAETE
ncbi:lysophospholipase L1-like esterase [Spinactinospora alkalitolerans]|uniref:Lysophospholipase L1-like esterase n=1 Tax=Spinactinospora alkalitolerans TaxID=687207 RepID=A0A852TQD3_9ACTN|nr:SGNH/GDSL hydrolase family protein [Spinactinospora alkalitolerans]NYE46179.1 lysophospholipase L1-like esterase [Spinactinospora alkalitolerans]